MRRIAKGKKGDKGNSFKRRKQVAMVMVPKRSQRSMLHLGTSSAPEMNSLDTFFATTAPATSAWNATFTLLNGIANGSQPGQRAGRKIIIKAVQFRAICMPQGGVIPKPPSINRFDRSLESVSLTE